jgi:hypothetical protein
MRLRRKLSGLLLVTFMGLCPTGALAPGAALAGTLDQQQINGTGPAPVVHSGNSVGQAFTAGLSGLVDRVDLDLTRSSAIPTVPLTVEIRNAVGGVPGGTILGSASIPGSAVPISHVFIPVDFAVPATVVAGTQYSMVAHSLTPSATSFYVWQGSPSMNPYPGGAAFLAASSPPSSPWNPVPTGADQAFKTYVVPSAPASPSPTPTASQTGLRAAALAKCKHKHSKKKRKRCRKRAQLLPL